MNLSQYGLTLMFFSQVFISSENHPMNESQGELLGEYPGEFPLGVSIDFTHLDEDFLPGRWVIIVDESKKPIILSDIRVHGSKGKVQKRKRCPRAITATFELSFFLFLHLFICEIFSV